MTLTEIIEEVTTKLDEVGCDPSRLSQSESIEFYEAISAHCNDWAETIRREMGDD